MILKGALLMEGFFFSLTIRQVCSWQHPYFSSKKLWASLSLLMECASIVASCHWSRNCPCFSSRQHVVQTEQASLLYFLLHRKSVKIVWARRLKIDAPTLQRNLGALLRQPAFSVISIVLEPACLHFLHAQVCRCRLLSLWWAEDKTVS